MTGPLQCAFTGCAKSVTYDYPLCYTHWKVFDRFQILECTKCHRFDEMVGEFSDEEWCSDCAQGKEVPVHSHAPVEHQTRYLYILKLDGGNYYVGQTNDLELRLGEHRDGRTK